MRVVNAPQPAVVADTLRPQSYVGLDAAGVVRAAEAIPGVASVVSEDEVGVRYGGVRQGAKVCALAPVRAVGVEAIALLGAVGDGDDAKRGVRIRRSGHEAPHAAPVRDHRREEAAVPRSVQ